MDNHSRFRMVDAKGEVIGRYPTACKAYAGFQNRDTAEHPDARMQIYGFMDSSDGAVGSYWHLSQENLRKLVDKETAEQEGLFCL